MASGQIRMTPDTMRERAGEYRTEADNVQKRNRQDGQIT